MNHTHTVEQKINVFYKLSLLYQKFDLDSSMMMLEDALVLAEEIQSEKKIAKVLVKMGHIDVNRDSLDRAMLEYVNAIVYYRKLNKQKSLCDVIIIVGNLHYVKGNYPAAMQAYIEALNIAKQSNYDDKLPFCYNNLGSVYSSQKDYIHALDYFALSLSLFEEKNDSLNIALELANIGSTYLELNSFDIARQYNLKAQKVYEKLGYKYGIAQSLVELSAIYLKNNQPDSALIQLKNSLKLYEGTDFGYRGPKSLLVVDIFIKKGKSFILRKDWKTAIENLMKGYELACQTNQIGMIMEAAELLSISYDSLNIIDSSYKYFKIFKLYSDSILNEDNIRKMSQMEFQNKLDQKMIEKELEDKIEKAQQNRRNLIYIIVFSCLIFLLILFILLLRLEKNKKFKVDAERIQLKRDVEFKDKELTTHVLYLLKKNEFILSISEKLRKIIPNIKMQNKKSIAEIIQELDAGSSTDTWKEFEIRFQQVHNSFFDNLNIKHPDLSPNELRLCAFLKLNMTTKDISAITYQSLNSIEMARFRLRKKLGIEKDEHLVSYLNRL